MTIENGDVAQWHPFIQRYICGEYRTPIFRDLILSDANLMKNGHGLTLLDIGCGGGFDSELKIQSEIASMAREYIGVEPDTDIELGKFITKSYRCRFEDANLLSESVDIAFAVMVLEHFANPQEFWDKVYHVLKPGGVFWGFTVDARHWFVLASLLTEKLHIKDLYLDLLHGKRGEDRYENYGVYYRSNTPEQIKQLTLKFNTVDLLNFNKIGQLDYYYPRKLRWIGRFIDRFIIQMGLPGHIMAVRVVK